MVSLASRAPFERATVDARRIQTVHGGQRLLYERELAKTAALADILGAALKARGIPDLQADLAALTAVAAFAHATVSWLEDAETSLAVRLDLAERELRALL